MNGWVTPYHPIGEGRPVGPACPEVGAMPEIVAATEKAETTIMLMRKINIKMRKRIISLNLSLKTKILLRGHLVVKVVTVQNLQIPF